MTATIAAKNVQGQTEREARVAREGKSARKKLRLFCRLQRSLRSEPRQSVLIFSILNHPCSFMAYYYLFDVFLSQCIWDARIVSNTVLPLI